jgi:hypothetical protein
MAWDLTITRADRSPLGEIASVRQAVELALPNVRFYREPSGVEKMATAGIEFPDVLRRHLESSPAQTQADYEGDGFSMRLYLGAGPSVDRMDAEVWGSGDPLPALHRLAEATGWVVLEASGSQVVP